VNSQLQARLPSAKLGRVVGAHPSPAVPTTIVFNIHTKHNTVRAGTSLTHTRRQAETASPRQVGGLFSRCRLLPRMVKAPNSPTAGGATGAVGIPKPL